MVTRSTLSISELVWLIKGTPNAEERPLDSVDGEFVGLTIRTTPEADPRRVEHSRTDPIVRRDI